MFTLEALDARHGDALILTWGAPDKANTALIDGGPSSTWNSRLRDRLAQLPIVDGTRRLAFVAVSHIDADHIEGVLRLLNTMRDDAEISGSTSYLIDRFWHNSLDLLVGANHPAQTADIAAGHLLVAHSSSSTAVAQSVAQGREAADLASFLQLPRNAPGDPVLSAGYNTRIDGLHATVIAPRVNELRAQWAKWRRVQERQDAQATAAAYSDKNVYNLASLVLFFRYNEKTVLLTGDARGDYILESLQELGYLTGRSASIHLDILKVPHHGSSANVTRDFFDRVTADHYVLSASGKHGHPHREVLGWIIESRPLRARYTLHITNPIVEPYDISSYLESIRGSRVFDVAIRAQGEPGVHVVL